MNNHSSPRTLILLISCPDRRGIVAAVTGFLAEHGGNIINLDEHVDSNARIFFMRVEWEAASFDLSPEGFTDAFRHVAETFNMQWRIYDSSQTQRMAVFVSKLPHCLYDILFRIQTGELTVQLGLIASNHPDLEPIARQFNIPFHHIAVAKSDKTSAERKLLAVLDETGIDFIVLARYMQILSPEFVARYPNRIINIHHSFLPAFPGPKPYHMAYARGVKIIGATSHYVTSELDQGPIIEQDVVRVSHKDSIEDFIRKGRDLEKIVLARAIRLHLLHNILVYNNKTVVFE